MKPAEYIYLALKRGIIRADVNAGKAFSRRGEMRCISTRGYIVGTVHMDGKRKQVKAHQIVFICAAGIPDDGLVIDHINGVKTDNRYCNLRLVTQCGNSKNRRSYIGEGNPSAKINQEIANEIKRLRSKYGLTYASLAESFGVSNSLVASIIRREKWVN